MPPSRYRRRMSETDERSRRGYAGYLPFVAVGFGAGTGGWIWRYKPHGLPAEPGTFLIGSLAALGVLMDDPQHDMAQMRPRFAKWCLERSEHLGAMVRGTTEG